MAGTAAGKKVFEVFVSKLPWTVATREVKEYFGQFGQVKKCLLPFDKETGFHRGFCWIGFSTEEGLQNVLQKDPHIIEGAKTAVISYDYLTTLRDVQYGTEEYWAVKSKDHSCKCQAIILVPFPPLCIKAI
ncbi:SRA stem-loop-interacting RNA-binding mitochondrial [Labeo rohita]|uniref:SRA stem-loop-interacting RNA-binding mitochondrial n=1 Tax=Labeo rohita TaxID=84645 RepID=A0A498LU32_LABRO|nr:SRA stem-loop-interacting RNA-binding mitochondrial [Labeo rohita]